jgi:phosphatidylglycerophosphate synthase
MARPSLAELRAATYKRPDAWWTVLLVDPLAVRLLRSMVRVRWITPNRITVSAFVLSLGAAGCYLAGTRAWLVLGAALYYVGFLLDCVDGKLARWQGSGTLFGAWLDYIFDRLRVLVCTLALMGGQYLRTGQGVYLALGVVVVFLDMFRYLDSLHMEKVKAQMSENLRRATADVSVGDAAAGEASAADGRPGDAVNASWRRRFSAVVRFRAWTERHRIRPHLMSGVEFQMFVLVLAPLAGAVFTGTGGAGGVLAVTVAACAVMLAFELSMVYKFWLSTRDYRRAMAAGPAVPGPTSEERARREGVAS